MAYARLVTHPLPHHASTTETFASSPDPFSDKAKIDPMTTIDLLCTDWPRCATVLCSGTYMRFLILLCERGCRPPFIPSSDAFLEQSVYGCSLSCERGCNSSFPSAPSSRQSNSWRHSAHSTPHMVGLLVRRAWWAARPLARARLPNTLSVVQCLLRASICVDSSMISLLLSACRSGPTLY